MTSANLRAARGSTFRRVSTGMLFLVAVLAPVGGAGAQTLPPDSDFVPLYCAGELSHDLPRDDPGGSGPRDVVGTPPDASLLFAVDDTHVYLRIRVGSFPLLGDASWRSFGWGFLFDTDGDLSAYEVLLILDGITNPDQVVLALNTTPTGDLMDPAETVSATYPASTHAWSSSAGTTLGGGDDWFVTMAAPLSDLDAAGVDLSTSSLWAGTSVNARSLNGDFACHDGSTGEPSVVEVPPSEPDPDPVDPTDGGATAPDGGIVAPDGGATGPDGGASGPDGGLRPPDGFDDTPLERSPFGSGGNDDGVRVPPGVGDDDNPDDPRGGVAGGAGCRAAEGGRGGGGLALAMLVVALAWTRRRRVHLAAMVAVLAASLPSPAHAQPRFTLDQYRMAPTPTEGFTVSEPAGQGDLVPSAQLHLVYTNDPLVYEQVHGDNESERDDAVVAHQLVTHLGFALGLVDQLVVFASLPVDAVLLGESAPDVPGPDGATLGDAAVGARWVIPSPEILGLAVQLAVTAPSALITDGGASYAGEQSVTLRPSLLGSLDIGRGRIALELGARVRSRSRITGLSVGHELVYGLGLSAPLGLELVEGHVELFGATGVQDFAERAASPLELLVGIKARPTEGSKWIGGLAGGAGLTRGYGAPDVRLVLTAGYAPPLPEAQPPPEPEAVEGEQGPPPPARDTDGDHVPDDADACPREPEDLDGFEDADGCIDADNDGDGVADEIDRCTDVAEDDDGVEDDDGCPEEDADGDSLADADDACPVTPGIVTAEVEECRGCPALACLTGDGTIRLLGRVQFESGTSQLMQASEPVLRDVLSILRTDADLRLRVEGHTDDRGDERANQELSEQRAAAIVEWLTAEGIRADRLSSRGFGETQPLSPDATPAARQANRRVEFRVLGAETQPEPEPTEAATDERD